MISASKVSNKGQLKVILKILTSASHMRLDIEHTKDFDTQVKSWHCEIRTKIHGPLNLVKFIHELFVVHDRDTRKGTR